MKIRKSPTSIFFINFTVCSYRSSYSPDALLNARDIALYIVAAIDDYNSFRQTSDALGKASTGDELTRGPGVGSNCTFESLPPELLAKVFQDGTDNISDAFRYSGISRKCRDTALCTPFLWTKIDTQNSLDSIRSAIERASDLCFSLAVDRGPKTLRSLDHMKAYHDRISSVFIKYYSRQFLDRFQGLTMDRLASWEMGRDFPFSDGFFTLSRWPHPFPSLRHYTGSFLRRSPEEPDAPWAAHLTSCSVSLVPLTYILNLPSCVYLELYITADYSEAFPHSDVWNNKGYNLSSLRHLVIDSITGAADVSRMLKQCIPVSQLHSLELRLADGMRREVHLRDALRSLSFSNLVSYKLKYDSSVVHGSVFHEITDAPVLERLEMHGVNEFTFGECIQMVKSFPRLKTVIFADCDDRTTNGIFGLAKSLVDPSRYPNFKKLTIRCCRISSMQLFRLQHLHSKKIYLQEF